MQVVLLHKTWKFLLMYTVKTSKVPWTIQSTRKRSIAGQVRKQCEVEVQKSNQSVENMRECQKVVRGHVDTSKAPQRMFWLWRSRDKCCPDRWRSRLKTWRQRRGLTRSVQERSKEYQWDIRLPQKWSQDHQTWSTESCIWIRTSQTRNSTVKASNMGSTSQNKFE